MTQIGLEPLDVPKPAKGDLELVSVTTIIGALDKGGLKYWAAEQAANAAIDQEAIWKAMLADNRESAVIWLRDAMNRIPRNRLSAADLGTVTHKACQEYALTSKRPDPEWIAGVVRSYGNATTDVQAETAVVGTLLDQFDRWLQRFTPTPCTAETPASLHRLRTCVATYRRHSSLSTHLCLFVTDYKTSRESWDRRGAPRAPYPDQVGLQLAAYRYAQFTIPVRAPRRYTNQWNRRYYLLSDEEQQQAVPVPDVDQALCIQVTPEHCEAYPIIADEEAHTAFLHVIEAFRWVDITSKSVMLDPLTR